MSDVTEHLSRLVQELRRGTITIGVLSQLSTPQYGYSLVNILSDKGVHVEPNTLYPLLRRLEKQGLLQSKWDTNESRPRKYYYLSETGKKVYDMLIKEWENIVVSLDYLITSEGDDPGGDD